MTDTATTGSTHEIRTGSARTAIDLLLVAVLGAVFLRVAVWPTLVHHYPFGVGPDMPVYLWWSRVGATQGISLVGERPGTPALIPTVATALGIGLVPAVAAVQYALMPASALPAAALARGRGEPPRLACLAAAVARVLGGIPACLVGPARLAGDTWLDAMLRRTGQWVELRTVYVNRLVQNWRRYAPFMTTALAVAGGVRARGFARRFLVAW